MDRKIAFLSSGVALFILLLSLPAPEPISEQGWKVIAVIALMLTWWVSEAVPIPVTALLPIILFPTLDITELKSVTSNYGHPIVFLFFGGFVIALAMQKWNLHKRIALSIVSKTGTHANGIILGFMLATAFLSMWISNTATTVMMLPIALSVLDLVMSKDKKSGLSDNEKFFALSLMIAVAFAANIGGTATLTGTPPNAIFAGFIENTYDVTIEYGKWMMLGVPFAAILLVMCWALICYVVYPNRLGNIKGADKIIAKEYKKLGRLEYAEKAVLIVFVSTAALWIFKSLLPFENISDHIIAVSAAVSLFLIPIPQDKEFLLVWDDMKNLPWGILLLFGGGLSVASAMSSSGLVEVIGNEIASYSEFGILTILLLVVISVLLLTELMSNLALITIFLPVLAGMAVSLNENPLFFAIPATLASSCAFMLPMATPPNAIVFASGHIRVAQMAKIGIVANILAITLITIFAYTITSYVFDIELGVVPEKFLAK